MSSGNRHCGYYVLCLLGKGGETIKELQERAGCKMQMIQDGPFANTPEKPLRMTGFPENCKVCSPHPSWPMTI